MRAWFAAIWQRPVALLWVAPALWSTNITLGRVLSASFPPMALSVLRWLVALAALLPFVAPLMWRQRALLRRHWALVVACGATGIAGYGAIAYVALATTPAATVAFINSALPLMVPLGLLVFAGERVRPRTLAGILVSFAGVAWIVARGDPATLASLRFERGELMTLVAVALYAVYSALIRRKPPELDLLVFVAGTIAAGIVVLLPFWAIELAHGAPIPTDALSIAAVVYIGLFISLLAFLVWNRCIVALGPSVTGVSYHLVAAFTAIVAYVALGEALAGYHVAGIGLILAGFFLASLRMGR
ncbi:MAG: DMT family transporter [Alphaproteobacteria bacterium]|nr:DMT family transporter [Alphaproteobacteria bacterium]